MSKKKASAPAPPNSSEKKAPEAEKKSLRQRLRPLYLVSFAAFVLIYALSGICVIRPEQEGLVIRFGKLRPTPLLPGTHYRIPWPVDQVVILRPNKVKSCSVGGRGAGQGPKQEVATDARVVDYMNIQSSATTVVNSQFLTGDENLIHLSLNIQYKIGNAGAYLFRTRYPDDLIVLVTESALATVVAKLRVDELLTTGKQWVLSQVHQFAQEDLNAFESGIVLTSVNFTQVGPPAAVVDAFKDVASALEDRDRLVNEAQGDYNQAIPRARGEADRQLQEARAEATSKANRARGDVDRFLSVLQRYESNEAMKEISLWRIYLETIEQVLPPMRKYILD